MIQTDMIFYINSDVQKDSYSSLQLQQAGSKVNKCDNMENNMPLYNNVGQSATFVTPNSADPGVRPLNLVFCSCNMYHTLVHKNMKLLSWNP